MAKIHDNGGVIGKTLDFNATDSYTTGSSNKKNSGIWNIGAAVKEAPPPDYNEIVAGFTGLTVYEYGISNGFQAGFTGTAPPDGTTIGVTASGTGITSSDFNGGTFATGLLGQMTYNAASNYYDLDIWANTDRFSEGDETVTITLDATDSEGNPAGQSFDITIGDLSRTRSVSWGNLSFNEGTAGTVNFTVYNNTDQFGSPKYQVNWELLNGQNDFGNTGGIASSISAYSSGLDWVEEYSIDLGVIPDQLTEGGAEDFTLRILDSADLSFIASNTVTVFDTSRSVLYGVYSASDTTPDEGTTPYIDFYVTNSTPTMYWSIASGTSDFDIGSGSVNWYTSVSNYPTTGNTAYLYRVNLSVTADGIAEGPEEHLIRFRTGSTSGTRKVTQVLTVQDAVVVSNGNPTTTTLPASSIQTYSWNRSGSNTNYESINSYTFPANTPLGHHYLAIWNDYSSSNVSYSSSTAYRTMRVFSLHVVDSYDFASRTATDAELSGVSGGSGNYERIAGIRITNTTRSQLMADVSPGSTSLVQYHTDANTIMVVPGDTISFSVLLQGPYSEYLNWQHSAY